MNQPPPVSHYVANFDVAIVLPLPPEGCLLSSSQYSITLRDPAYNDFIVAAQPAGSGNYPVEWDHEGGGVPYAIIYFVFQLLCPGNVFSNFQDTSTGTGLAFGQPVIDTNQAGNSQITVEAAVDQGGGSGTNAYTLKFVGGTPLLTYIINPCGEVDHGWNLLNTVRNSLPFSPPLFPMSATTVRFTATGTSETYLVPTAGTYVIEAAGAREEPAAVTRAVLPWSGPDPRTSPPPSNSCCPPAAA